MQTSEICEMSLDDLKADFMSIMSDIVILYGDDESEQGTGREETQPVSISQVREWRSKCGGAQEWNKAVLLRISHSTGNSAQNRCELDELEENVGLAAQVSCDRQTWAT